jgi:hypothetical protein
LLSLVRHGVHKPVARVDPTGIYDTLKLTKQWIVQLRFSAGHDVAPWSDDRRPSAIACLDYSTVSNKDNFYACANGINSGKYAYNNLQNYDGTLYHKFNARHTATEAWYMYERDVPNVAGNVANPIPTEAGANGAFCKAGEVTCTAPEYAVVNYVNCEINTKLFVGSGLTFLTIRRDRARGVPASVRNQVHRQHGLLRPQLRFDNSWNARGYFAGKSRKPLFFGMDVIYKF